MRTYLDFQTGDGWEEISSLVHDKYSITHRASSDEYHYAVNVTSFTINYDASIFSSIRAAHTAHTNILVKHTRLVLGVETTFFYGYYDTNSTIKYNGMSELQTIDIEAQDFTEYLNVEVGDPGVAYEDYQILNPANTSASIVHQLFTKVGLSLDLIDSTITISTVVGAFTSASEDDTVLDLLDTLLFEHGYVANWNTEGKFSPIRWIPAVGTTSVFVFNDTNVVGEIEESKSNSDDEGAQVIWYGLDEKENTRIYTEDLPFDSDGDFEGYAVLTEVYYPTAANVIDETTGIEQIVFQEYEDTGIQYKTSRYVQENYALDFSLEHADFSEILITRDHTIEDHYDAGLTRDVTLFFNKKARIRYYNPNLTSRWIYYMNINATVIYKRSQQKCTVENVANTGKLAKYDSRFIFERSIADTLCAAIANNVNQGTNKWVFVSEEEVDEGSFVTITLNNGTSAYGFILERTYDGLTAQFSYTVRGVSYTFLPVARRYVIESTIMNSTEMARLSARPATPIIQINGDTQFTYTGAFTVPYPLALSLAVFVDGATPTTYQWYARDAGGVDQAIAGATNSVISIAHTAAYLLNPETIISCLVNDKWSSSVTLLKKVVNTYRVQLTGGASALSYDKNGENPSPASAQTFTATYYINDMPQTASYAWSVGGCLTVSGVSNVQNLVAFVNPEEQAGITFAQCVVTASGNAITERRSIGISYYDKTLDWAEEWDATKEDMYASDPLIGERVITARLYAGTLEDDPDHIGFKRLKTGFAIGDGLQVKSISGTEEYSGIVAIDDGVIKALIGTDGNAIWGGTITTSGLNTSVSNINNTLAIGDDGWAATQGDLRTILSEEGVATQAYIGGNWIEKTFIGSPSTGAYGVNLPDGGAIKWKNGDVQLVQVGSTVTVSGAVFAADSIRANLGFTPDTNGGAYLGTSLLGFSVLHLCEGAEINWDGGDAVLTQSNNTLNLTGADFVAPNITAQTAFLPDANDGAALGTTALQFSDLFLAEGAVINWDNGDVTLSQSGNNLSIDGANQLIYRYAANNLFYIMECFSDTTTHRGLLDFYKSATDELGANAATVDGDILGSVRFIGNSGAGFTLGCEIRATQIGAASTGTPSYLTFITHTGSGAIAAMQLTSTGLIQANVGIVPDANDGAYLGTSALGFSDLFLAEGAVINWDNGDCTLTQAGNVLTLAGADFVAPIITVNTGISPDANDGAYLGTATLGFSDLFLALGAVINFDSGDVTLTHSANYLTLAGGSFSCPDYYASIGYFPVSNDGASLGASSYGFSDLFLAEGGVINWDNGDATLTQAGNMLTIAGADLTVPNITLSSFASGNVRSGTYTPTVTPVTNIAAMSVAGVANWLRVGNIVFVTGLLAIDATLYNTASAFTMTIPIASDFTQAYDAHGVLGEGETGRGGHLYAETVNNILVCFIFPGSAAIQSWSFSFSYIVQ